jgi:hypothetical protein
MHQKEIKIHWFVITLGLIFMSLYPVYKNYLYGGGYVQYDRHIMWLNKESGFFNPWQYRILCPLLIEFIYQTLNPIIQNIPVIHDRMIAVNIEKQSYTLIFFGFRFIQNLIIYLLSARYFKHFISSKPLLYLGLMFICLFMGNALHSSDFSFNNYMNIILLIWTCIVILEKKAGWWIVVLCILGALNRETSLVIPMIYLCSQIDFKNFKIPQKALLQTVVGLFFFAGIFIAIRLYFGYRPSVFYMAHPGIDMIINNLFSFRGIQTWMEWVGTFAMLPILCFYFYKNSHSFLKLLSVVLLPVWFSAHLILVVGWETRYYLIPCFLVFIPMALSGTERNIVINK